MRRAHPFPLELRVACTQLNGEANCASHSPGSLVACVTAACSLLLITAPLTVPAQAASGPVVDPAIARSPELSETSRLSDRRFVVTGDRAWALAAADGRYPAAGFHTRGEMGGFWLPNLKLLDGMWFNINGDWIERATKTTSGWGYVRADLSHHERRISQPHRLRATRCLRRAGWADAALRTAIGRSRCARTRIRS